MSEHTPDDDYISPEDMLRLGLYSRSFDYEGRVYSSMEELVAANPDYKAKAATKASEWWATFCEALAEKAKRSE